MKRMIVAVCLVAGLMRPADGQEPKVLATGLKNPESVALGPDGRVYVTTIGEFGKDGDGAVMVLDDGKAVPFVEGLDDPKGLARFRDGLFVADNRRVLRIDKKGKMVVVAPASAFPKKPHFLNDIVVDPESGLVYVSDTGDRKGKEGAIFRIDLRGKVTVVTDATKSPAIHTPNGLVMDGASHLLLLQFGTGTLHRVKIADGSTEKVADGLGGGDGLAWDSFGRLFISDWSGGRVRVIARPGAKPQLLPHRFTSAADLCLDATGQRLLVPDMKAGTITAIAAAVPDAPLDERPMALASALAFPNLKWTGWQGETENGLVNPLRPIVLTHAGDGSNRVFVATQHGVIHHFPNDPKADKTTVFLDIQAKVRYDDKTNEEGFLGLTFHPHYKKNGTFYVFYTDKKATLTNVLSRFRVSKDDPSKADPDSEEELLRIERPFWNHDGGTLCFGPDGYLYVALGDGGKANDPFDNGQNLKTILGTILRLDVDRRGDSTPYAIPKDNPFVGKKDARPEIWAYGLRNVWRMAFDRATGQLWAGDVGQNLYEEIDLIVRGGNYGWNRREGLHPFGVKGTGPRPEFIEPIWEYHHDIGKSITAGLVYRGKRLPELEGTYLYGDYITNKLWSLRYDAKAKRVVANRPIPDRNVPMLSFGEDEAGEVYYLTYSVTGQGIYRFVRTLEGK